MEYFWIWLSVVVFLGLVALITSYICYRRLFHATRTLTSAEEYPVPNMDFIGEYAEAVKKWSVKASKLTYREVEVKSFDGLTLRGKYYEKEPGAPIEIMFHGYRGDSARDLTGGIFRCFSVGHNALLVDQRASGRSEGRVITFGVNESRDCEKWINYVIENINPEAKIILSGVSMGASTVMIAAGRDLPENVVGVLADCGYTSARAIIKKVMKDMKLPSDLLYPFAILGGKLFGGFNIDETSSVEMLRKAKVPVIIIHGAADKFVPCGMSVENYDACASVKRLVTIDGAGHGLAYPVDPEKYVNEVRDFFTPILGEQKPFDED